MELKKRITSAVAAFFIVASSSLYAQGGSVYTDSGLNTITDIIKSDVRLNKRVSAEDIAEAVSVAEGMNELIIEAIIERGLANDGDISKADVRDINVYLVENYRDVWAELHGDDEDGEETGFHLVQNDGARTKLFGKNAINNVADSIYHLGFETHHKNRLLNEDGNKNRNFKKVALWVDNLLVDDLEGGTLENSAIQEVVGNTGTGLDQIIEMIYSDARLAQRVSTTDIREGSRSANAMNKLLIEAIFATDAASDGSIGVTDAKNINQYLVANHAAEWAVLHGDDEDGEETGFHRVQNDGAKTKIFGKNAINNVADSIYHLGFEASDNRLLNEDGNKNKRFRKVASWLNLLLLEDISDGNFGS